MSDLTDHDYEQLSAYLDEALTAAERAALEARLRAEPALRAALDDLRVVQQAVASLPVLRAPRDFRLTHDMVAPPMVAAAPIFDAPLAAQPQDEEEELLLMSAPPPPAAAPPDSAQTPTITSSTPPRATRATPWWLAAAAALALLIVGGGVFVLTQRQPEPTIMIAALATETASPTTEDAPLTAVTLVVPPSSPTLPEVGGLRQQEASPLPAAPLAMQATSDPTVPAEAQAVIPMLAAVPESDDAAADEIVQSLAASADTAPALETITPQALADGLVALLRLLLELVLRS